MNNVRKSADLSKHVTTARMRLAVMSRSLVSDCLGFIFWCMPHIRKNASLIGETYFILTLLGQVLSLDLFLDFEPKDQELFFPCTVKLL